MVTSSPEHMIARSPSARHPTALIIRHRCQRCGASSEGGTPDAAWVRCPHCRAVIDFDWLGFFESPAYATYLAQATTAAQQGWPRYQAKIAQADALLAQGDQPGALAGLRDAVTDLLELTPFMYPPEVRTDARYRAELLTWQAWWLLQTRTDERVRRLQGELEVLLRAVDYRDPLPTLREVAARLRVQSERLGAGDAPPDPDGMTPPQRSRVWVGVMLGAWVRLLSGEQRLELLRELHGAANVLVAGGSAGDEVGLFVELACPACGLHSLQARSAAEHVCLGCFFRRAAASAAPREAVEVHCPNCHAAVALGPAAIEVTCAFCGAAVHRLVETGQVVRAFAESVQRQTAERTGITAPAPSIEGTPGLAVTAANRRELAAAGLARTADAYAALITPARYAELVRATAIALGCPPSELIEQAIQAAASSGTPAGRALLAACRGGRD